MIKTLQNSSEVTANPSERVEHYIGEMISRLDGRDGARLPTIRKIASEIGVSTATVQGVFRKLSENGVIRTEPGSGTFIVAGASLSSRPLTVGLSVHRMSEESGLWVNGITNEILFQMSSYDPPLRLLGLNADSDNADVIEKIEEGFDADGLIMFSSHLGEGILNACRKTEKSVMFINPPFLEATSCFVSPDYFSASAKLAEAFIAGGRRKIAYFCHKNLTDSVSNTMRLNGLVYGIRERLGHEVDLRVFSFIKQPYEQTLYDFSKEVFQGEWKPDAIYCSADSLALGTIRAVNELGIDMPNDCAVVGGTGLALENSICPGLARMRQPFADIAQAAVRGLYDQITGHVKEPPGVFLPLRFVGGDTVNETERKFLGL